jgi:hypothetical protein
MLAGTMDDLFQGLASLCGILLAEVAEKVGRDVIIERSAAPGARTPTLADGRALSGWQTRPVAASRAHPGRPQPQAADEQPPRPSSHAKNGLELMDSPESE